MKLSASLDEVPLKSTSPKGRPIRLDFPLGRGVGQFPQGWEANKFCNHLHRLYLYWGIGDG